MKTSPDGVYHAGMRRLQDEFDTRRLADRLDETLGRTAFSAEDRAFIESRALFFLATADAEGRPECSYKGDDPGCVRATFTGAQLIVRVRSERIFPNCPRYIHRMQSIEPSPFVPRAGRTAPVPAWKRFEAFRDVLGRHDPAGQPD